MVKRRLNALVLAGGRSQRMGSDKAAIEIDGQRLLDKTFTLAAEFCELCRVSVRPDQMDDPVRAQFNPLPDSRPGEGPLAGILSALESDPDADWLVLACDMPGLDYAGLDLLIRTARESAGSPAVAIAAPGSDLPEPLCAIWRQEMREPIVQALDAGRRCARKVLLNSGADLVPAPSASLITNMNTPSDREAWQGASS